MKQLLIPQKFCNSLSFIRLFKAFVRILLNGGNFLLTGNYQFNATPYGLSMVTLILMDGLGNFFVPLLIVASFAFLAQLTLKFLIIIKEVNFNLSNNCLIGFMKLYKDKLELIFWNVLHKK